MGPVISLHMLAGAVVGWGLLSPIAKHQGWASGAVGDWENGSRGWIIWVSLASLFADAGIKMAWFLLRLMWKTSPADHANHDQSRSLLDLDTEEEDSESLETDTARHKSESHDALSYIVNPWFLGTIFLLSIVICTLAVHTVFGRLIPWYFTMLGIALSLPMAVVGIRSMAETNYNPESALGLSSVDTDT
jgi:uncharacterized oligopeptide transporter (OPT) family protein